MTRNGTALTTMETRPGTKGPAHPAGRAEAGFTTQLLAVRLDSPAYRQRRRIEPALGVAAYRDRLGGLSSPAATQFLQA